MLAQIEAGEFFLRRNPQADFIAGERIATSNFADAAYWSVAQLVAHHTVGGCALSSGDLFGSGTLSGALPGQAGSLSVYNHLAQLYGAISPEAAKKGLELYAEHTEDARGNPGKHPNIDRLIGLIERGETLRVKQVFAV